MIPQFNPRGFNYVGRSLLWVLAFWSISLSGWSAQHVIHISVDGLRPDFLQTAINRGNAPNFLRFLQEGAWTNNARTDYSHTITLPNHTSMITGRPVSQPTGLPNTVHHGYTDNGTPSSSWTLHNQGNQNIPYKASTFDVAHDAGLSTALFASKSKFVIFDQSYNAITGAEHANGRDKIDTFFAPESTATMQAQLLADLAANRFNYTFLHYADTDDAGHGSGWGSATWYNALSTIDGYLGQVFNLVETDPVLAGQTTIILTADHGGSGTGHSTASSSANYTIPFYVWGAGVAPGDLYAFNGDTRTNPGTSRPTYVDSGQPIRNGDSGNLALTLLGLDSIPGSLINEEQNLRVAPLGDYNLDGLVNIADYAIWRDALGSESDLAADGNGNLMIDSEDYDFWKSRYGQPNGSGTGSTNAVPEPTAVVLWILIGGFAWLRFQKKSLDGRFHPGS